MLTKEEFYKLLDKGPVILDGATGSNLQKMGMPRGCCTESWILEHPQALIQLQAIFFTPQPFRRNPLPLPKKDWSRIRKKSTSSLLL